ncbi:MAG: DUF2202 domain-containing protein [Acidobacteriaceae bacterium]
MNTKIDGNPRQGRGMGRGRGSNGNGCCGLGGGMGEGMAREGAARGDISAKMPGRSAHRQVHVAEMRAQIAASPRTPLTPAEQEGLLLMREEEKIARDVYIQLYERWGLRPFGNISGSEQAHMDAVLALLEHFGLPDPARGLGVGQFRNPELQRLHDTLLEQGLRSPEDAVQVGLLIEELDIDDLQKAAQRTEREAIRKVYGELERGSRNHLRAFYRWKTRLGVAYQPKHLTPEIFMATALSPHEACILPA